ncbi:hypothetical protein Q8A67_013210 [Cirrhinus molitorella]|uniref:Secreted protein n=1 Tax=Cirrhinus molitorella TaxID=172907 RepID=A0AA88PP32_9TELE|nr:hypothetical protein Q8A67_013210 [Cirrhinus molitorella]
MAMFSAIVSDIFYLCACPALAEPVQLWPGFLCHENRRERKSSWLKATVEVPRKEARGKGVITARLATAPSQVSGQSSKAHCAVSHDRFSAHFILGSHHQN